MFCHKTAGKELTTFSPRIREPAPSSFHLSIKYFVKDSVSVTLQVGEWKLFGSAEVVIWADVAPKACQLLRKFAEKDYPFTTNHSVRGTNRGVVSFLKRIPGSTAFSGFSSGRVKLLEVLRGEADQVEKQSGLWTVPDSVVLNFDTKRPHLDIFNQKWQSLKGRLPNNKVTNDTHGERPGMVVGKVLSFSPGLQSKLQYLTTKSTVVEHLAFECSVVETDS